MFHFVQEETLTAKDRNKLSASNFGLPDERKFPLTDEEHVRKAIQFFKFCPPSKKTELAANINKKLTELNMTVKVGDNNPFKKFAKPGVITESFDEPSRHYELDTKLYGDIGKDLDYISMKFCRSVDDLLFLEQFIQDKNIIGRLVKCLNRIKLLSNIPENPIMTLNTLMAKKYISTLEYLYYDTGDDSPLFLFSAYEDIFNTIIFNSKDETYDRALKVLILAINRTRFNYFYLYRKLMEIFYDEVFWYGRKRTDALEILKIHSNELITDKVIDGLVPNQAKCLYVPTSTDIDPVKYVLDMVMDKTNGIELMYLTKYLEGRIDDTEKQIYIITPHCNKDISVEAVSDPKFNELLTTLDYQINLDHIEKQTLNNAVHFNLSEIDIILLKKITDPKFGIKSIGYVHDMYCTQIICILTLEDSVYLIGQDNHSDLGVYLYIDITNKSLYDINNGNIDSYAYTPKCIDVKNKEFDNTVVTEGLSVDKDGTIKIRLSSRKSYMDTYMENHKLLVENWKNKNYKGVKECLACAFALVNIIERHKKFKERDGEFIKARAFLMNDFKTYLKKLQEIEPKFDFVSYYKASNYDKLIIDIPTDSITGIKKIFKTIMMS